MQWICMNTEIEMTSKAMIHMQHAHELQSQTYFLVWFRVEWYVISNTNEDELQ
jgi:hypothetical protein